jgi:hypothetical protein
MPQVTFGGETPLVPYAGPLTLTVEAPDGTTEAAPVIAGQLYKLSGTAADGSGYKIAACTAGDDPLEVVMVMALHRMTQVREMGVVLITPYRQVRRLPYISGAAPSLGNSIEAAPVSTGKIAGIAYAAHKGIVLSVNTADLDADVLI